MLGQLPYLLGAVVSNLLMLVGLTYLVSLLVASLPRVRTAYHGAVFGLALGAVAGFLIFGSIEIGKGAFLDLWYVVVLMSGLIGGPIAALVTAASALLFRLAISSDVLIPAIG